MILHLIFVWLIVAVDFHFIGENGLYKRLKVLEYNIL